MSEGIAKRPPSCSIDSKTLAATEHPDAPQPPLQRVLLKVKPEPDTPSAPKPSLFAEDCTFTIAAAQQDPTTPALNFTATNLFNSNGRNSTVPPKTSTSDVSSLFASNGSAPGLFGKGSIATTPVSSQSLFGKKTSEQSSGVDQSFLLGSFGPSISTSLFGQKSSSLFNFSKKIPPVRHSQLAEHSDEDGSGEEDSQKPQEMVIDKSKAVKDLGKKEYKYAEECTILKSLPAKKYRRNDGDLIPATVAELIQEQTAKTHWIIIRLAATRNCIFAGLLVKGRSTVRILNQKSENLEITAVRRLGKVAEKNVLKLQFGSAEEGQGLHDLIEGIVK